MDEIERVWKSQEEDPEMHLTTTEAEFCERARAYESENVWVHRIVTPLLVIAVSVGIYQVVTVTQPWIRFGQAWTLGAFCWALAGVLRRGPRTRASAEPCARFLEREFEGKRETYLGVRRAMLWFVPSLLASWWGGLARNPNPYGLLVVALTFGLVWFVCGREAAKAQREASKFRHGQ